jgi:hypothetical protein
MIDSAVLAEKEIAVLPDGWPIRQETSLFSSIVHHGLAEERASSRYLKKKKGSTICSIQRDRESKELREDNRELGRINFLCSIH